MSSAIFVVLQLSIEVKSERTCSPWRRAHSCLVTVDYGFYGGLVLGSVSAVIVIASLLLQLGVYGGAVWLLSLILTGAIATFFYVIRSPVPVKPKDVLKVGGIAGVVSAVVQWLLLVLAYFVNTLPISLGSAEALLLFVCLLCLLGCVSPISAIIAVRYLKREKLTSTNVKGHL